MNQPPLRYEFHRAECHSAIMNTVLEHTLAWREVRILTEVPILGAEELIHSQIVND